MTKFCEWCGKSFRSTNVQFCSNRCKFDSSVVPIGSQYERWTVLENHHRNSRNRRLAKVLCRCGKEGIVQQCALKNGTSKSCGCYKKGTVHGKITHGMTGTPEWKTFHSAKKRCTNPNDTRYHRYGGRGVEFRFGSFQEFYEELGTKPSPQHSINRINNDGHYEPGNVEWATDEEQRKNKSRNGPRPRHRPP